MQLQPLRNRLRGQFHSADTARLAQQHPVQSIRGIDDAHSLASLCKRPTQLEPNGRGTMGGAPSWPIGCSPTSGVVAEAGLLFPVRVLLVSPTMADGASKPQRPCDAYLIVTVGGETAGSSTALHTHQKDNLASAT